MNIVPSFEQGKLQQNGIEAVSETNLFFLVTFNHNQGWFAIAISQIVTKLVLILGALKNVLVYFLYCLHLTYFILLIHLTISM